MFVNMGYMYNYLYIILTEDSLKKLAQRSGEIQARYTKPAS